MKKKIGISLATVVLSSTIAFPSMVYAKDDKNLLFTREGIKYIENNQPVKNRWINVGGSYYYFGNDGIAYKGWHYLSKKENEKNPHWSYFGNDGRLRTGWQYIGEKDGEKNPHWSYFGDNGWLRTGWQWLDKKDGQKEGHFSYFGNNGWLRTGWQYMGEKEGEKTPHWSYFGDNGWLRTGWQWLDKKDGQEIGHFSYFGKNGWLRTGFVWFDEKEDEKIPHFSYFGSNGWLHTNVEVIKDGEKYFADSRGWLIKIKEENPNKEEPQKPNEENKEPQRPSEDNKEPQRPNEDNKKPENTENIEKPNTNENVDTFSVVEEKTRINISFETIKRNDENIWEGEERVITNGKDGVKEITTTYRVNDRTHEKTFLKTTEKLIEVPINKVILVGTKNVFGTKEEITTLSIPYSVEYINDENIEETFVERNGSDGIKEITTTYKTYKGEKTNEVLNRNERLVKEPISKIVRVKTENVKKEPSLELLVLNKNDKKRSLDLSYRITDEDETITKIKVKLSDGVNEEEKVLDKNNPNLTFKNLIYGKKYKITSTIEYNLLNSTQAKEEVNAQNITLNLKKLTFNDYKSIKLYKFENGYPLLVTQLNEDNVNVNDYYAQIVLPSEKIVNVGISRIENYGTRKKVILNTENLSQENGDVYEDGFYFYLGEENKKDLNFLQEERKKEKTVAYENMKFFTPIYNKEFILSSGDELDENSNLSKKKVKAIIPIALNKVSFDVEKDANNVNKILVRYEDGSVEYFNVVSYEKFSNLLEFKVQVGNSVVYYTPLENKNDERLNTFIENEFSSIELLTNEVYKRQLQPPYIRYTDILEKKKALNLQSDDEARELIRQDYLEKLSFGKSFSNQKENIAKNVTALINKTYLTLNKNDGIENFYKKQISNDKEKLLLGLTYLNRLYNINYENINIYPILVYYNEMYGNVGNKIDFIKNVGNVNFSQIEIRNNEKTFAEKLSKIDNNGLFSFLEKNREIFLPNITDEEWFKNESKAYIVEEMGKSIPNISDHVSLYKRLKNSDLQNNKSMVLGLLTLEKPSVYVISTMSTITFGGIDSYMDISTYENNKEEFTRNYEAVKEKVDKTAKRQASYQDVLYRISKENNRNDLVSDRIITDTMKRYTTNNYESFKTLWSDEVGAKASESVKEFMSPFKLWTKAGINADAEANGVGVRFIVAKVLEDRGANVYSHELTHLFDNLVLLDKNGRRDGIGAEVYARGIFEVAQNQETDTHFNMNMIYDESGNENRMYNAVPERFKNADDLKTYTKNTFDVIYTLDAMEANASTKLSNADKVLWFKKIEAKQSTRKTDMKNGVVENHLDDNIRLITEEEASHLNNINDLVDNDIIARRFIFRGTLEAGVIYSNNYYVIDMFTPMYSALTNENGASGDLTTRRNAWEILAEFGYYDGFVPYMSNKYKEEAIASRKPLSDTFILSKILNGSHQNNLKTFKKDMYQRRISKENDLKEITINYENTEQVVNASKMKELFEKEMKKDINLIKMGRKAMHIDALKKEIYRAYLLATNDFSDTVYER